MNECMNEWSIVEVDVTRTVLADRQTKDRPTRVVNKTVAAIAAGCNRERVVNSVFLSWIVHSFNLCVTLTDERRAIIQTINRQDATCVRPNLIIATDICIYTNVVRDTDQQQLLYQHGRIAIQRVVRAQYAIRCVHHWHSIDRRHVLPLISSRCQGQLSLKQRPSRIKTVLKSFVDDRSDQQWTTEGEEILDDDQGT